ncbi:MAG: MBL fold metallo-hydrolase [Candidatus Aminicenantes bacterium]|nr:MBL fold metallo-hydrolase [Candidatus Aminicenantes bacterium]
MAIIKNLGVRMTSRNINPIRVIRTFHPVGQGAFYTERHMIDEDKFTIVFDCGSTTLKEKELKRKIYSTFPKDHRIDILFISHFHADHINGLNFLKEHCEIKNVVLPLVSPEARVLLKISNYFEYKLDETLLIDDPKKYFGEKTNVISVDVVGEDTFGVSINFEDKFKILGFEDRKKIPSGQVIVSGFDNHNWFFIPFNYRQEDRKRQFIDSLRKYGLELIDIDTIENICSHKDEIKKAYEDIEGDLNENSMLLFSGIKQEEKIINFQNCHQHCCPLECTRPNCSCIYFGDIDLNEGNIVGDIHSRLKNLLPSVGTIQVPHHGSIHNFNRAFLTKCKPECAIISFGNKNSFGHPSDRVIEDILSNKIYPYLVTENQCSMVTQLKYNKKLGQLFI